MLLLLNDYTVAAGRGCFCCWMEKLWLPEEDAVAAGQRCSFCRMKMLLPLDKDDVADWMEMLLHVAAE